MSTTRTGVRAATTTSFAAVCDATAAPATVLELVGHRLDLGFELPGMSLDGDRVGLDLELALAVPAARPETAHGETER